MSEHNESDLEFADEFGDVESLLRELTQEDHALHEAPPDLWDGIAAEVSESAAPSTSAQADDIAPVVSLQHARRLRRPVVLSAAVAAMLIVVVGVAAVLLRDDAEPQQLAVAELSFDAAAFDPLGADASASVSLIDEDGVLRIAIDDAALPAPDGEQADLELWMISVDGDGNPADIVSLGLVDPSDVGTYAVPEGIDPDVHFVVDISVEPRDGDGTHSGRSILRGVLTDV